MLTKAFTRKPDLETVRRRPININFSLLWNANITSLPEELELELFDGTTVTAIKELLEVRSANNYSWFGRIKNDDIGSVTLTVVEGVMAGNIVTQDGIFQIRTGGDDFYLLREIDQSLLPEENHDDMALPEMSGDTQSDNYRVEPINANEYTGSDAVALANGTPTIDVMVVYTQTADNKGSGIRSEIQLAIDDTNRAYSKSGVNARLRLVHSTKINYTESSMTKILGAVTDPRDGQLDNIHSLRKQYSADVISIWVAKAKYCGRGWPNANRGYAFSVVMRSCATSLYSFGHEIGHNMGLKHDRKGEGKPSGRGYAYGYQSPSSSWRTIMSTNCSGGCTRIPYFSNPNKIEKGEALGVPVDQPDAAYSVKKLIESAPKFEAFSDNLF